MSGATIGTANRQGYAPNLFLGLVCGSPKKSLTKRNASRSIFFSPGFSLPDRREGKEKAAGECRLKVQNQRASRCCPQVEQSEHRMLISERHEPNGVFSLLALITFER